MAGGTNNDDDEITAINVTPLVDVMLVLLIIFMVTTTYIVNRTIQVKLPSADTGETKVTTKNLAFVLSSDEKLFVDGQPVDFAHVGEEIQKKLQEYKEKSLSPQALITADKKVSHGLVVKLIDAVRKNGITEFAINVESSH